MKTTTIGGNDVPVYEPKPRWNIGENADKHEPRSKFMCDELLDYCERCCETSNAEAKAGNRAAFRYWEERAQNARLVLVDFGVLPPTAI
jgi:hypothetical protein